MKTIWVLLHKNYLPDTISCFSLPGICLYTARYLAQPHHRSIHYLPDSDVHVFAHRRDACSQRREQCSMHALHGRDCAPLPVSKPKHPSPHAPPSQGLICVERREERVLKRVTSVSFGTTTVSVPGSPTVVASVCGNSNGQRPPER